jgi:hypothetical protein
MIEMAISAGADAVVGLKFDCSEITQSLSEVAAYGTAVRLVPIRDNVDASFRQPGGAESESGDQLGDDQTVRSGPPSWPSNEAQQQPSALRISGKN